MLRKYITAVGGIKSLHSGSHVYVKFHVSDVTHSEALMALKDVADEDQD